MICYGRHAGGAREFADPVLLARSTAGRQATGVPLTITLWVTSNQRSIWRHTQVHLATLANFQETVIFLEATGRSNFVA
jgi:hypothetical protein